uniref:Putative staphylococcal nuclease (SNase-like) n=1 Tax=Magnetococcus massalia (strain MO-1) TaxID=451514 RepID=A0A1S7LPF4_MAGMO|nr:Putative staphylococcal nuclease (SNase-like) [Candidatus Magnetococcus massalia]
MIMRKKFSGISLTLLLLLLVALMASDKSQAAKRLPLKAQVGSVWDGDTFTIHGVGRIRIMGIDTPEVSGKLKAAEPFADTARDATEKLLMGGGKSIFLIKEKGGQDRDVFKRPLRYIELQDGRDVGEELLKQGLALVYVGKGFSRSARYFKAEMRARSDKLGVWSEKNPHWLVKQKAAIHHVGDFRIVQGRVKAAAKVGSWIYLNYGKDYKKDFTVSIKIRDWKKHFRKVYKDPQQLVGQRIEVRGRIGLRNGAMIRARHPDQIQKME